MNETARNSALLERPRPDNRAKTVVKPCQPRLAFLGLGWIGRRRFEAIARSGMAHLCAVADPCPDAAAHARELAPDAAVVDGLEGLLELRPDGVVIATPSALHARQAVAALEHGCGVFCQKPLAPTAAETRRVVDAARAANRRLGTDFSYRHTAGMQAIRRLIRAGELGQVYAADFVFHNAYGPDKAWFYEAALSGGGCLIDLGIHLVDLALWCLDFPRADSVAGQLAAGGKAWTRPSETLERTEGACVEDYASAQVQLENGTILRLVCSWNAPAGCDARIEATFFGTDGGATWRNVDGSFFDFAAERLLPDRSRQPIGVSPHDWESGAILQWVRGLSEKPDFDAQITHAVRVAEIIEAIYRASS